jgi:RNA polymerase primary sigma factor
VKVPGRRGRKPSEFTPENDEVAALNAVERAELKAVSKARDARPRAAWPMRWAIRKRRQRNWNAAASRSRA